MHLTHFLRAFWRHQSKCIMEAEEEEGKLSAGGAKITVLNEYLNMNGLLRHLLSFIYLPSDYLQKMGNQ